MLDDMDQAGSQKLLAGSEIAFPDILIQQPLFLFSKRQDTALAAHIIAKQPLRRAGRTALTRFPIRNSGFAHTA